ncbi:hypothetical protein ACTHPF_24740 [Paenibacillus sp. SAF-054]|uniref:hypothetical protein n=1 Tax=unclassified Paenibacillus TaxID=185978 RepID=UPI003F816E0C
MAEAEASDPVRAGAALFKRRGVAMVSSVILQDLIVKRESKSYTDALYAILTAAGLFEGPKYMLSALSGMAFIFAVHERLLHLSVTAYGQWGTVHKRAADSLGIYTVWDGGRTRHPTFPRYQQDAVQWIKESLDKGIGVVYWIPEFGVIYGYDDEDRVFYVQDGISNENRLVLYDNLGLNFTPFWHAQAFGDSIEIHPEQRVLEALRMAIDDWNTAYPVQPDESIASGRMAYSYLIRALMQGEYDEAGAVYILESYQQSRHEIMLFLKEAEQWFPELKKASDLYEQTVSLFKLSEWISTRNAKHKSINSYAMTSLIGALEEACRLEDEAVNVFRGISGRYPDLKRFTVPRWGLHIAR